MKDIGTRDIFFFQAEDGIRDLTVTGVQTCALPISIHTPYAIATASRRLGRRNCANQSTNSTVASRQSNSMFASTISASPDCRDRKSTRLNSSHSQISYAVFCLKKKKKQKIRTRSSI